MAHFLKPTEVRIPWSLGKPRAAVRVRVVRKRPVVLQIDPEEEKPILVLSWDAQLVHLPEHVKVIDQDGKEVKAHGQFAVTVETITSYHLLTDLF